MIYLTIQDYKVEIVTVILHNWFCFLVDDLTETSNFHNETTVSSVVLTTLHKLTQDMSTILWTILQHQRHACSCMRCMQCYRVLVSWTILHSAYGSTGYCDHFRSSAVVECQQQSISSGVPCEVTLLPSYAEEQHVLILLLIGTS